MKKVLSTLALLLACSGTAMAATCLADVCGPATRYDVTVLEVALCQEATCTSPAPYIVGSGTQAFDIASATVGAAVGSYAGFDQVPAGTYTHMRSIVSSTFTITGAAIGACAAQNAAALTVPNGVNSAPVPDAVAAAGLAWLTWNDAAKTQIKMTVALPTPLLVSKGSDLPSVSIAFGTQTALACVNALTLPIPQPPEILVNIAP